jgi:monoamine oxidase
VAPQRDFDVIVVGGGFAGVTAARDLSHAGHRVLLLEARDQLGGRTCRRTFAGTDMKVEFGGTWTAARLLQPNVGREIIRYDRQLARDPAPLSYGHLLGGERIERPFPLEFDDLYELERAAFHILSGAKQFDAGTPIDEQFRGDFDVTWAEFAAQLDLSPRVYDLISAWALQSVNGEPHDDGSALNVLWGAALFQHSLLKWHAMVEDQLRDGVGGLLHAMVSDANCTVRTATPVASVEQDSAGVEITTIDGQRLTCRAAVIAVPVNAWNNIAFAPALSPPKVAGAALRPGGRSIKMWALVEDAPPGFFAYGGLDAAHGVTIVIPQGEKDGAQLLAAFTPMAYAPGAVRWFDPSHETFQLVMDRYAPGSRVVAFDAEDYTRDPWVDGSFGVYKIGQMAHLDGMRSPEGRLAFAGSDIARGWVKWIDGAIESGSTAGHQAEQILAGAGRI